MSKLVSDLSPGDLFIHPHIWTEKCVLRLEDRDDDESGSIPEFVGEVSPCF